MKNAPDYKANDPRGWGGDPRRGAALGRPTIHEADLDAPIKLHLARVYIDAGGYDPNGTYFGIGDPLYWYTDAHGTVDAMLRAMDRGHAIEAVRAIYQLATFYAEGDCAGEAPGVDAFVLAYVEAALWSSADDNGDPLDDGRDIRDVDSITITSMIKDCRAFREQCGTLLAKSGQTPDQSGHDFWLTRNHCGAGFWDRGLGEIGNTLTEIAKRFGEINLYVGDDGKIHA